jgi:hypothetical protein
MELVATYPNSMSQRPSMYFSQTQVSSPYRTSLSLSPLPQKPTLNPFLSKFSAVKSVKSISEFYINKFCAPGSNIVFSNGISKLTKMLYVF